VKAAVVTKPGQPPTFEEFPDPEVIGNESLVKVSAAALPPYMKIALAKPIYTGGRKVPYVPGLEGIGTLEDGTRVIFYTPRAPWGSLAEYVSVEPNVCIKVPDGIDDAVAASLYNPGLTNTFALSKAGALQEGGTLLLLGGTGFAGKLALQMAKVLYKAGRVVVAGRDEEVLESLGELGADATIQLDQSDEDLAAAFNRESGENGYDVILDYVWGRPAEVLLDALPRHFMPPNPPRYVQLGNMAGERVSLHADTIRRGGVHIVPASVMGRNYAEARVYMNTTHVELMNHIANGLLRLDIERVPLANIEEAWQRLGKTQGRRMVMIP
jgi:NADPH:quinone reductase-like Zn-dependent oxidoreductase